MIIKVKDIAKIIEDFAPLSLQESYDNAGLLVGDSQMEVTGVLITVDVIEAVIDEAIEKNCNLIVAHHPLIFSGLKRLTGQNYIQKCVIKAIKNDIAIYSAHTNLDNVYLGVNGWLADKLELNNKEILLPKKDILSKLITYVPKNHVENVKKAIFDAGAGKIGNYDCCSFDVEGEGSFRANNDATPFVGEVGERHIETEIRVETIVPNYEVQKVVSAMLKAHPYEEPAFDIVPIKNSWSRVGAGMVGELTEEVKASDFLQQLKEKLSLKTIRYTGNLNKEIKKVALCGGSGSEFLKNAIHHQADIYISGDFKYHQFFDAEDRIIIADIGHFESEVHTKQIFYELISKKIPTFAVKIADSNTNPINYL